MSAETHIAILGAGSWGTALAIQLAQRQPVTLWGYQANTIQAYQAAGENIHYLPGIAFPPCLLYTSPSPRDA